MYRAAIAHKDSSARTSHTNASPNRRSQLAARLGVAWVCTAALLIGRSAPIPCPLGLNRHKQRHTPGSFQIQLESTRNVQSVQRYGTNEDPASLLIRKPWNLQLLFYGLSLVRIDLRRAMGIFNDVYV
jgi:hypothetical protein